MCDLGKVAAYVRKVLIAQVVSEERQRVRDIVHRRHRAKMAGPDYRSEISKIATSGDTAANINFLFH
jgi:hypothetical protein